MKAKAKSIKRRRRRFEPDREPLSHPTKAIKQAVREVTFVHVAIPTRIRLDREGFHVQLDIHNRETGEPATIDFRWDLPHMFLSKNHAMNWIYACVRDAWVHELNENFFVNGLRRRDLHDENGRTVAPPDERGMGRALADESPWLAGFAVALAEMHRRAQNSTLVCEVARDSGVTLENAKSGGVSLFDLAELRRAGIK